MFSYKEKLKYRNTYTPTDLFNKENTLQFNKVLSYNITDELKNCT